MKKTVITIARSYGSGGRTLGMLLADKLGINCYDREILRMASDESGINEALFGEADEKLKKSPLLSILRKNPYKGGVIPPESSDFVSDDNLFNYQAKVIKELAEQESCIIIGHLADYILKDDPDCIKVFIYAPFEERVKMIAKKYQISEDEARKVVRKMDQSRSNFYTYYSNGKWEHGKGKDLILNRSTISLEDCVEMIAHLVELKTKEK